MVKVKSIGAVINGRPIGSIVEMTKHEAEHYSALGYVEIIETKQPKPKKESAPKKASKTKDSKK